VNGHLYDSETMNEVGSTEKLRGKFWWQMGRGESFSLPTGNAETYLYTYPGCD
jgi:hypothetical protein